MSKDIRSFFTVLSKKSGDALKLNKPKKPIIIDSDDEDVIESTPKKQQKSSKSKRRAAVLSSDSEEERTSKNKSPSKKQKTSSDNSKKDEKPKLKPIDLDALNQPIKQSEVKYVPKENSSKKVDDKKKNKTKKKSKKANNAELGIHEDKEFEKTLEDLDADTDDTILLDNLDFLDKTIEDAALSEHLPEDKVKENKESTRKHKEKETSIKSIDKTHEHKNQLKTDEAKQQGKSKDDKNSPSTGQKRQRKNSEATPTPKKKQKLEQTESAIDQDLEKWEKKRQSAGLYVAYLHRGAPKHQGEKEYPKGKPDCLGGVTFLRTGVLDSLDGDEFGNLVTDHGGKVVHGISKKVNYVVVGDQPGPAKLEKARKYNIPELSEDEFLDLILVKSGQRPKYAFTAESEDSGIAGSGNFSTESGKNEEEKSHHDSDESGGNSKERETSHIQVKENSNCKANLKKLIEKSDNKEQQHKVEKEPILEKLPSPPSSFSMEKDASAEVKKEPQSTVNGQSRVENLSWTDKYRPTNIKSIIGQQDSNSNMNKLKRWLENWFKNSDPERRKKLPRPTLYNQYDGAYFKAALLSGSPGVGKTTTATLVAKELGFDIVEFNASDTRSKKLLHEEISHMMRSKTVAGFATGQNNINQKRVLLMDEVDGMAGNEDRGGIAELISFIKTASFPIICMCNNRDLPKMRSLVNHCYALKFGKPNVVQVRGAMMTICFKEGLSIKPDALAQLITGTGCDIRQTLNHLSMWSAAEKTLTAETVQKESKNSQKDVVFGAWDVIKKVFNTSENKDMTLADKSRLFFYDYSFGPMFVQENYLTTEPECTGPRENRAVERLIRRHLAADCLSRSDMVESKIRSTNNWSLLESQAFYSTVLPSHYLSGKLDQVRFPGWFGKNSKRNKSLRMVGELYSHARTSISGDKFSVRLDYAEPLMNRLVTPLKEKQAAGIDDTLAVMRAYSLLRDDLTNLCELMTSFENTNRNPFDSVSASVKSALTRKYNKTMVLSFAPPTASKKKKVASGEQEDLGEEEDYSEEEENDDNIDTDALIKVKNKNSAQAGGSKASGSQKEGKPKGKGSKSGESKSSKGKAKK